MNVVKSFLLQSPPGEFNKVLFGKSHVEIDLRILIKDNLIIDSVLKDISREYYEKNQTFLEGALISSFNKKDKNYVYQGSEFKINFETMVFKSIKLDCRQKSRFD